MILTFYTGYVSTVWIEIETVFELSGFKLYYFSVVILQMFMKNQTAITLKIGALARYINR